MKENIRIAAPHLALPLLLLALHFLLPDYHHGALARVMVLAVYAMGYNLLFGYAGLLSLGHALFFAAGMYGAGLGIRLLALPAEAALAAGVLTATAAAALLGALALRAAGAAFMIVTLMFAEAFHLLLLYFGEYTRGDEGFVIPAAARRLAGIDLTTADGRYLAALALFTLSLAAVFLLARAPFGRVLAAIRDNEDRARMLGYDVYARKLAALTLSGGLAGAAGACYALLFGYVGAGFATVQYSILPLLWVLLGGAGTVLGPLLGVLVMFYLIDFTSGVTDAYMLPAGAALVLLVLFARRGLLGEIRARWAPRLP